MNHLVKPKEKSVMKFDQLELNAHLLKAVHDAGYTVPSPIQQKAIPPVLSGRDLLGCAQTGTGKTAAFALPILHRLQTVPSKKPRHIRALILTPTRELALQIQESFTSYGKYLPLRSAVIFGGVGQNPQVLALKQGVDILVATPGRLLDLMQQGFVKLSHLEIFVLDEADRMLDMGFVHDVKKVMKVLPPKRQTLLFSATMPPEISKLAGQLLHNPAKVMVTPVSSTVESIQQCVYKIDKNNKKYLLAHLLHKEKASRSLVFTRTKHGADRVVKDLNRVGFHAKAIHGNKSQTARQEALACLKDGRVKVLVATDIAARGLDISELSHVFNYDLPNIPETYVHRIGRTGRAGRGGVAVSFCTHDELPYLADIETLIGFHVPEVTKHAWPLQGSTLEKTEKRPLVKEMKKQENKQKKKVANEDTQNRKPKSSKPQNHSPTHSHPTATASSAAKNIVTKRPVWSSPATSSDTSTKNAQEGDMPMSKGTRRHPRGRNRPNRPAASEEKAVKQKAPEIPKDKNGIFDFSEEELAQDTSLRLIRDSAPNETKFANFEEYLKAQKE